MKTRELENLGFITKEQIRVAKLIAESASKTRSQLREDFLSLIKSPTEFINDPTYSALAVICGGLKKEKQILQKGLSYSFWGDNIDDEAHQQMQNACQLPISAYAALMPDAHVGYGLPIGGVLATRNAVIPYAVGVDIACRVMVSITDLPLQEIKRDPANLSRAIEENTRFGIGANFSDKKQHAVLDENWDITSVTSELKDLAWRQLGTSGSGNHFVEFGEIELLEQFNSLAKGKYLALVSHSGSRGPGSKVCAAYSEIAMKQHTNLPKQLKHLAWLSMDSEGAEYWQAMELMGKFASANHHLIHRDVCKAAGAKILTQVENHHNFAWKETHFGEELIVHRKGATPAAKGEFGYIPGTMVAPGYLVRGLGNQESLNSSAHGAGRVMSRKAAKHNITRNSVNKLLDLAGVRLLSAGIDEAPQVYKDINAVIGAQNEHIEIIGRFYPKIVKMAPEGEKAED